MVVDFSTKFHKTLRTIRDASLRERIAQAVHHVQIATTLYEIPNLKKLAGHSTAWRIRVGDYRIGLHIEAGIVNFSSIDHRSNFYDHFPD